MFIKNKEPNIFVLLSDNNLFYCSSFEVSVHSLKKKKTPILRTDSNISERKMFTFQLIIYIYLNFSCYLNTNHFLHRFSLVIHFKVQD